MVWNAVNTAPELSFCAQNIPLLLLPELSKPQVGTVLHEMLIAALQHAGQVLGLCLRALSFLLPFPRQRIAFCKSLVVCLLLPTSFFWQLR